MAVRVVPGDGPGRAVVRKAEQHVSQLQLKYVNIGSVFSLYSFGCDNLMKECTLKVIVVGEQGVGKTSLLARYNHS
jgi:GTPase SAR1 family protein